MAREVRVVELRYEMGRRPIERRAPLLLDGPHHSEWVKCLARDHHARTVRRAGKVPQHHPKAVVERNGDADPIALGQIQTFSREETVVQDVVVRQGGALREAGRSRCVLDVDRIVELKCLFSFLKIGRADSGATVEQLPPRGFQLDRRLDRRTTRSDLFDHVGVVGLAEASRVNDDSAARLVERVFQLVHAVRRIDIHEDRPDLGGRVLNDDPLVAVGRPDTNSVALVDAQSHEAPRAFLDLLPELGVCRLVILMPNHERLARAVGLDGPP